MEWYEIVLYSAGGSILCLVLAVWYAVYRAKKWLLDDVETLEKRFNQYKWDNPDATDRELIKMVINRECLTAGIVGFFTGVGGVTTMPITLPLDIIASIRIQTRLTKFVQWKLGDNSDTKTVAIAAATNQVTSFTFTYIMKMVVQFAPKLITKSIPLLGGIIGAIVDSSSTKALGEVLLKVGNKK